MDHLALVLTLIAYKLLLLGIGVWASKRTRDNTDFYLGGRQLGPWVAAVSSAASSSSAWTLLGVSGAAYLFGLGAIWILPGCVGGFALNWFGVAGRLHRQSQGTQAVTLNEFLCSDMSANLQLLFRRCGAVLILLCLGVYVSSQFQAAGQTFADTFEVGFQESVLVGGAVVFLYTILGGFWAVSLTDLVQGLVMALSSLLVPAVALVSVGGIGPMLSGMEAADPVLLDPFKGAAGWAAVGGVIGYLGIGLGYPGQPHVVNRFMALRDGKALRQGRLIAMTWAVLTFTGMLLVGWCAHGLIQVEAGKHEGVLMNLTLHLFPEILAGIVLAAILSAIMSTADSQLLVCGSTVSNDWPQDRSQATMMRGRWAVFGIGIFALILALTVQESIFNRVLFAWSALGASFGPLLLVKLSGRRIKPMASFAALFSGFVVTIAWYSIPALKSQLYELVPAFAVALTIAWLGSTGKPVAPNPSNAQ